MPDSRFQVLLNASVADRLPKGEGLDSGLSRLWRGFMAARILVAAVLLLTLLFLRFMGIAPNPWAMTISLAYLVLTVWVRVMGKPMAHHALGVSRSGRKKTWFDPQWLVTVGADVLVFGALLYLQVGGINYTALFALPVLLAAVLGTLLLALGTAAVVTITLLADALQFTFYGAWDAGPRYIQAALTGTGLFAVAYLTNQLSIRLIRQEKVAQSNEMMARMQLQVNQLVIDALSDGVLVIDRNAMVHAANPAALEILGMRAERGDFSPFPLASRVAWKPLAQMAIDVLDQAKLVTRDLAITDSTGALRQLHIKTQLVHQTMDNADSTPDSDMQQQLCVMFIQDLREIQARVRTEKLASMGRMSAAVAHEIRNPLSAIAQANALLAEEIQGQEQHSLVRMIAQNVQRLSRVVDDVLDVSRAQGQSDSHAQLNHVSAVVREFCQEWRAHHHMGDQLLLEIAPSEWSVQFEHEHMRRIVVNLLDNAKRYATGKTACIQVKLDRMLNEQQLCLSIWSDGKPLEQGVQRHLFEPFFSSESRSSGLGLFICRELCSRHGASINYQRGTAIRQYEHVQGNEFFLLLQLRTQRADFASSKN